MYNSKRRHAFVNFQFLRKHYSLYIYALVTTSYSTIMYKTIKIVKLWLWCILTLYIFFSSIMYTMHVESKHFKYIGTYPFQAPETLGHTTYTKVGTIFHASTIYVSTFFWYYHHPSQVPTYIVQTTFSIFYI